MSDGDDDQQQARADGPGQTLADRAPFKGAEAGEGLQPAETLEHDAHGKGERNPCHQPERQVAEPTPAGDLLFRLER